MELIRSMTPIPSDPLTDCPTSGQKRALLIAVKNNNVKGYRKLPHTHRDARELQHFLIEVCGYPAKNIVLMMDDKSCPNELFPTKTRIKNQIRRFVKGVSAGDHLFFYYSGHGHQVTCHHNTEPDGLDEEIFTCNGREIIDNDLKEWLVKPLPPGCKLFALWDSCHSLTILDLDHYNCNEPRGEQFEYMRQSGPRSTLQRVLPKRLWRNFLFPSPRNALNASRELRGRPITRTSVSITAVSAGNSPPLSKWIPFSTDIRRALSPSSWLTDKCDGRCPLPGEGDTVGCAHVISLSACKDNESAFDDVCSGTVTTFFIEHLRENPNSTLRELLLAIRQRVDEITAARKEWDMENGVIARRSTFAIARRIKTEWVPQTIRRLNTEASAATLENLQFTPFNEGEESQYSQKPSYSSHYPLNLDELVDL